MSSNIHLIAILLLVFTNTVTSQHNARFDRIPSLYDQIEGVGGDGTCRISSRELLSSAQETANRILQGVCNPRELDERLVLLETRVGEQFNVLKMMILDLETKLRDQDVQVKRQHKMLLNAIVGARRNRTRSRRPGTPTTRQSAAQGRIGEETGDAGDNKEGFEVLSSSSDVPDSLQIRSGDEHFNDLFTDEEETQESPRASEIATFNSTIHMESERKVFTYYWKVDDIRYRMENWRWRRYLRSSEFYIFRYGYRMFMKVFPNHDGENVFIHVGLTKGDYDASLEWPFTLPMMVSVLDHSSNPDDIQSRMWLPADLCSGSNWQRPVAADNEVCVGLGFLQSDLNLANYIHDNSLYVRLTVFLD